MNPYSPRSDAHLVQPESKMPRRSGPAEPDNVPFARRARVALLEELDYYRRLVADNEWMDDDDKRRMAYLEGQEAEVLAKLAQ